MGQSQALERPLRVNNLHFAQLQLTRRASKGRSSRQSLPFAAQIGGVQLRPLHRAG
jgi:hypothetical protein